MAVGAHAYRRTIERKDRGFNEEIIKRKRKRNKNKTNVTTEKDGMTSVNQTPGGYKFAPLVADQLWQANRPGHACFGLSSPRSFLSRSGILLHAIV